MPGRTRRPRSRRSANGSKPVAWWYGSPGRVSSISTTVWCRCDCAAASPRHPPGFYGTADMRRALNLSTGIGTLKAVGPLPSGVAREGFAKNPEIDIRPSLLTAAFLLALADLVIGYWLRGLLRRRPARIAATLLLGALLIPTV